MNPHARQRKNTLEDNSATTVTSVWSHTGQWVLVTWSGERRLGSLKSGIGD
jgi:hypothetical protein